MFALHAGFSTRRLILWGEMSGPAQPRRTKSDMHPGDAGPDQLLDTLAAIGIRVARGNIEIAEVSLPTVRGAPIPSSPLIGEMPGSGEPKLASWKVTVARLEQAQALELLCLCAGKELLHTATIAGVDLTYWTGAMRFAAALAARQQFLPDLANEHGRFHARWRAAYVGRDNDRRRSLAAAMPPAARALTPEIASETILDDFLDTLIDELVRASSRVKELVGAGVHDRWLAALHFPIDLVAGTKAELQALHSQIRDWRRPISIAANAPYRLCFRLEEPENDTSPELPPAATAALWQVRYLLQARTDPSLLVPAEAVWKAPEGKSKIWSQPGFQPREHLLFSLGQASGICPRIEDSLKTPAPAGYELDAAGAHDFLNNKAIGLEEAGFGVMLPGWWSRRKGTKARLSATVRVKSPFQKGAGLSLSALLDFDWQVSIGGENITLTELRALAALKAPLVKFRGQWVQVNAEEIQAALEFWKKKERGQTTAREVLQMALGASELPGPLQFSGVDAEGWIGELIQKLQGHTPFAEAEPPPGLLATLRPYQIRGYSWLAFLKEWGLGACLADDMGLGKTVQTLSLIQRDWSAANPAASHRPVLLLCPTSVIGNWQKEAARFTPQLPVMVHHGVGRTRGNSFVDLAQQQAIVLSSYTLLHRDFEHLKEVSWGGIVLDEAQNIKNPETKQAVAARALTADYRIALTGTPVENNVGDLWSIMDFLNPGLLGTRAEFKRNYFLPIQSQGANQNAEAATAALKKATGPFILRRLKTDQSIITDLPQKLEMKVFCTLTKEQASLYSAVVNDSLKKIESSDGIQRKGLVLATLARLKQVCNHPAQFLGDHSALPNRSGKLSRLTEMLEEAISVGDRVLIFSQFAQMGEMLRLHLQETFGRETLFLHGGVPKKHRDRMVERFQDEPNGPPLFILSLKAGGTGLNLTRASHVFHFDRWWNPAVENQATDRAFRIGQKKNVQVHKFVCAGTLEERIDEMIEQKTKVAAGVLGVGEGWLTELSTTELRSLFALQKNAVEA
jgi:SNF2 family DNA or RNA helicase